MEFPSPSQEKVKVVILWLKNNKAAGPDDLSAKLFKTGCDELVGRIHQLVYKIWLEESMPNDWNLSVLLLHFAYKVLTSILYQRLKPLVKTPIGLYQ